MSATWKLIIEDDAGKQIVVPFTRDVITIGRKEGNTIRLTERNVSRNHARLSKDNGHVVLEDLKSFNGIKLNGDRIEGRVMVHEGDTIQIGDYHLALHAQDGAGTAPAIPSNGHGSTPQHHDGGPQSTAENDEFAGDTQRWEPPPGSPPMVVGGLATVEDRAISDENTARGPHVTARTAERAASGGFGADSGDTERVTMDMLAPLSAAGRAQMPAPLPMRTRDAELEPTVRQPTAPPPISMPPSVAQLVAQSPTPAISQSGPHVQVTPVMQPMPMPLPTSSVVPLQSAMPMAGQVGGTSETRPEARALDKAPPLSDRPPERPLPTPTISPRTSPNDARAALEEQTEAMRASPGGDDVTVPRLVVLNTIFSGSTFSLRASEAVIGRTEDNDITIEHKSVSRNHAKVVREGDRVRILDLKSANGVLVNNEEVEQAVLRSGDVVELGRVKMRFVPIGERFAVAPDEVERARIADVAGDDFESDAGTGVTNPVRKKQPLAAPSAQFPTVEPEGRPKILFIALGGVVLLAVIALVLILRHGSDEKKTDATPVPPPTNPAVVMKDPTPPVVPTDAKPTDAKPTDAKPADAKPAEATPDPPPVEVKPADVAPEVIAKTDPPPDEKAVDKPSESGRRNTGRTEKRVSREDAIKAAKVAVLQKHATEAIETLKPYENSDNADVHRTLGVAYAQLKRNTKAAAHYRRYLELSPNAIDADNVREILKNAQ